MRAPFATTFDIYAFPIGGIWGPALGGPYNGRLVEARDIEVSVGWQPGPMLYLTTDEVLSVAEPEYFFPDEFVSADFTVATVIAVPSGGPPTHLCLRALTVTPLTGPPYFRYTLYRLP